MQGLQSCYNALVDPLGIGVLVEGDTRSRILQLGDKCGDLITHGLSLLFANGLQVCHQQSWLLENAIRVEKHRPIAGSPPNTFETRYERMICLIVEQPLCASCKHHRDAADQERVHEALSCRSVPPRHQAKLRLKVATENALKYIRLAGIEAVGLVRATPALVARIAPTLCEVYADATVMTLLTRLMQYGAQLLLTPVRAGKVCNKVWPADAGYGG